MSSSTAAAATGYSDMIIGAYTWVVEGIKSGTYKVIQLGSDILSTASPYVQDLASKIVELAKNSWIALQPVFVAFFEFLKSPIGTAAALLVATIVFMKISQTVEESTIRMAFFIIGISSAILTGAFLLHTGLLPASIPSFIKLS